MAARRRNVWIGIGLVVLVGGFVALSLARSGGEKGIEVRTEAVGRERIESWVRAPGQVRPERLVQISSNVQGRVERLRVAEGDRVARGDLLLTLDDERYRSMLAGIQAQVDAAAADLRLAEAQRKLSQMLLDRQERLFAESLVSDEAVEEARTRAAVDEARHASTREELRRRRASLAEVQKDLEETVFRAPIDGVVTALNVEAGENVITGTMNNPGTVILTLADLDTMEVAAEVDETDVVRVRPGQSARVRVDAWEDSVLAGTVTSLGMSGRRGGQAGQQQGTSFEVLVRILEPPDRLRPGMSADIDILTGEKDSALVVPIQALVAHPKRVVEEWMADSVAEEDAVAGDGDEDGADDERPRRAGERHEDEGRQDGGRKDEGRERRVAASTSGELKEALVEGIFLSRDGRAVFVPVRLGLRGDTVIEIDGAVSVGDIVVTGPYRVLRKLEHDDAIRPEETKRDASDEGEAKRGESEGD